MVILIKRKKVASEDNLANTLKVNDKKKNKIIYKMKTKC